MKFIYLRSKEINEEMILSVAEYIKRIHRTSVEILACKDSLELAALDLKKNPAEVVVTFNLAGFDISTLTDGLSYNLVDSKFIHFLLHENLPNEKYLSKQLSISMFFYCVGKEYCDYLWKTYPEIPWLKELTGWNAEETQNTESNVACIVSAIEEVIRECRL